MIAEGLLAGQSAFTQVLLLGLGTWRDIEAEDVHRQAYRGTSIGNLSLSARFLRPTHDLYSRPQYQQYVLQLECSSA